MAPGAVSARVILCHDPLRHSPRLSICSPLKKTFYSKASLELIHFYFHFHTFNSPPLKKFSNQLSLITLSKFQSPWSKTFHCHDYIFENLRSEVWGFFIFSCANTSAVAWPSTESRRCGAAAKISSEMKIKKVCDLEIESKFELLNFSAASI